MVSKSSKLPPVVRDPPPSSLSTSILNASPILAPAKPAHGLLPPAHDDAIHTQRCLAQLRSKDKGIEKYIYLSQLKHAEPNIFYRLCLANMAVSL